MSKSKGLWNVGFNGVWQRNSLISQMLHLCESPRLLVTMSNDPALGTITDHSSRGHNGTIGNMTTADRAYMGLGCTYDFPDSDDHLAFADHADHSFGNGSTDSPFTAAALIYVTDQTSQTVMSKWNVPDSNREWLFWVNSAEQVGLYLSDQSAAKYPSRWSTTMAESWHWVVATYSAATGGNTAANDIDIYVDGVIDNNLIYNQVGYVAMENLTEGIVIGNRPTGVSYEYPFTNKIGLTLLDGSAWSQRRVTESYRLIKQAYGL